MKRKKVKRKILLLALFYFTLGLLLIQSVGTTIYQIHVKRQEKSDFSVVIKTYLSK